MMKIETKITEIYGILNNLTDGDITFLEAENSFQLLIGVILSAQTTDRQVNTILPHLFAEYPAPEDLGKADTADVAKIIRPVGFFNTKARSIISTASIIAQKHTGRVPETMEELLELPGVGRKSANVIRGACFGLPAIIVDTHFARTVSRLGLTEERNPDKIEYDLSKKVPQKLQYRLSMLLNKLGRDYCRAQKPQCPECPLKYLCSWEGKSF